MLTIHYAPIYSNSLDYSNPANVPDIVIDLGDIGPVADWLPYSIPAKAHRFERQAVHPL